MKKTILEEILVAEHHAPEHVPDPAPAPAGVLVGRLTGFGPAGEPVVEFPGNPGGRPVSAGSTVRFGAEDVGCEVALLFEDGDRACPLVIGRLIQPKTAPDQPATTTLPVTAAVDGDRLTFTAEKEIVLRCGAASITLTRAGKVLIRGKYVLSRSSGVNRVKGGSIQLN